MKPGDLVVHIGATPNGYRALLVCGFSQERCSIKGDWRETIFFGNGRSDWKDQWRIFTGWDSMVPYLEWKANENR